MTWCYYSLRSTLKPTGQYLGILRHRSNEDQPDAEGLFRGGTWFPDNTFGLINLGHEDDLRIKAIDTDKARAIVAQMIERGVLEKEPDDMPGNEASRATER